MRLADATAIAERLKARLGPHCDRIENAIAITKLEEALMWLNARTKRRVAAGVEGTAQQ